MDTESLNLGHHESQMAIRMASTSSDEVGQRYCDLAEGHEGDKAASLQHILPCHNGFRELLTLS